MKSILALALAVAATPTPLPSPPLLPPRHVIVENQQSSFFPTVDQETGVWQGCGPAHDQGALVDFNREHPRARIVQVFIDASIPCQTPGTHAFVVVYQDAAQITRRGVRYPMNR